MVLFLGISISGDHCPDKWEYTLSVHFSVCPSILYPLMAPNVIRAADVWKASNCSPQVFSYSSICSCVLGTIPPEVPIWWSSGCQSLWRGTMFPCHVTPWPSAEPPASCGSHAPPTQPSQPLPDLLCSCPAPPLSTHCETPSPDPMESLIVVTEYEPSRPPGEAGEEEVRPNTPR